MNKEHLLRKIKDVQPSSSDMSAGDSITGCLIKATLKIGERLLIGNRKWKQTSIITKISRHTTAKHGYIITTENSVYELIPLD